MTLSTRFQRAYETCLPWFMRDGEGQGVAFAQGYLVDEVVDKFRYSLTARFPDSAPDDAFPYLGRDRKIVRGINEPKTSYASRLKRYLDDHRVRGTAWALLSQLQAYLQAPVKVQTVDNTGTVFEIAADGTRSTRSETWNWDGYSNRWSRFWVIIYPEFGRPWPSPLRLGELGDTIGTAGRTIGGSVTKDQANQINSIIQYWKPAGTSCWGVILAFEANAENLLPYSFEFSNAAWTRSANWNITGDANQADPFGGAKATLFDISACNAGGGMWDSTAVTFTEDNLTRSIWLKGALGGEQVSISDPLATVGVMPVVLTTSWQRFVQTEVATPKTSAGLWLRKISGNNIYAYGAQVERNQYASKYLPSQGSAVDRALFPVPDGTWQSSRNRERRFLYWHVSPLSSGATP